MSADPQKSKNPEERHLYRDFLAEREEILKHKWIRSEGAGRDVGFEAALVDWAIHHRETWKREYLESHKPG